MKIKLLIGLCLATLICSAQNWQQIGPRGGYFRDFAIHPTNNQIVFAGSDDCGGIWKSTDGGNSWALVTEELPDMTGWHIQFDSTNTNILYACDYVGRHGVIKSIDGGNTWTEINNGLITRYDKMVTKIVIDPSNNQTLYISTGPDSSYNAYGNGVFKSINAGSSWFPSGLQDTAVTCIAVTASGKLFAGVFNKGVYYSANGGATWNVVAGIPPSVTQIEAQGNVIAIAAGAGGNFLSTNDGASFSNIGLIGEYNFDISIASVSPNVILYSPSTTILQKYSSLTGNWTVLAGLPNDLLGMGIAAKGNEVYYAVFANTEFWHSTDGGTSWNLVANSPQATELSSLAVDPNNANHFFGSLMGTYNSLLNKECLSETTNGGSTWTRKGPNAQGYASGLFLTVLRSCIAEHLETDYTNQQMGSTRMLIFWQGIS